jgi:WD40 repeat protein
MACLRLGSALVLSLLLSVAAVAQSQPPAAAPGLYDRPVLVIDPGLHTAMISGASVDAAGRWGVTGSLDKTVRVWSLADGALQRTIRLPAGPGDVGNVYSVAMSPDGALIAAAGWTRWTNADSQEQIYIYDRESGALVRRIEGLPETVEYLVFSLDGRLLAATLGSGWGLRIYGRDQGWAEIARDDAYGDDSYGASFAPDGRLAVVAYDLKVRLYASNPSGSIKPVAIFKTPGVRPFRIAFSPDGARLAVGYRNAPAVDLLDGQTLAPLPRPNLDGIEGGNLAEVAWSRDGLTLFAAGNYQASDRRQFVLAWGESGTGARRALLAGQDVAMSLAALPNGDLLVAEAQWLARMGPDGTIRWVHAPPRVDFRNQNYLSVSDDGSVVDFAFRDSGKEPARFNLASRTLALDPPADKRTVLPRLNGLPIAGWHNTTAPTLEGRPLQLDSHEHSRRLAISPTGDRFVLGADWTLRAFDAKGTALWTRDTPETVWAVNITGDGRLVVAAHGDGTIRWHRMSDGVELLAFKPMPDKSNWVAWTPEGFYAATAGAQGVLRWHVNHGWDAPGDSVAVEDILGSYRPNVLPLVLQELETPRALGRADLAEHDREIMIRTNSKLPPGVKLHLLAIGIDAYNEEYAKNLRLNVNAGSKMHRLAGVKMHQAR